MQNYKVSTNELQHLGKILLLVALSAVVNYLAANLNVLPFTPVATAIIAPVILGIKYVLDGKVTQ